MRRVLGKQTLVPHPATPAAGIESLGCKLSRGARGTWLVEFVASGAIDRLLVPPPAAPERADGLWQTTCFELFVRPRGGDAYFEFNWSPSGRWAAYGFDGYRAGMRDLPDASAPVIEVDRNPLRFRMEVAVDLSMLPRTDWEVSLSAPIEESDGTRSFWALAYPPGKPDFHHDACFALHVPAPERA